MHSKHLCIHVVFPNISPNESTVKLVVEVAVVFGTANCFTVVKIVAIMCFGFSWRCKVTSISLAMKISKDEGISCFSSLFFPPK